MPACCNNTIALPDWVLIASQRHQRHIIYVLVADVPRIVAGLITAELLCINVWVKLGLGLKISVSGQDAEDQDRHALTRDEDPAFFSLDVPCPACHMQTIWL